MRLFISLNFEEQTLRQFENWQRMLQEKGIKGYWRRRDNLHLTLKFIGEVEERKLDAIQDALTNVSGKIGEFDLEVRALGVFPNPREPRILWAGIENEPKLITLYRLVQAETAIIGFEPESREYKPHLTLASGGISGMSKDVLDLGKMLYVKETVTEFHLMQSKVDKGTRSYLTVARYPL